VNDKRLEPGFNVQQLQAILLDHPDADSVMIVGHEPDFSETIGALIGGSIAIKKGGLALVELERPHSKHGDLLWLIPPKFLTP
jgi:phosphohistidine phosphatase